jgi:hypothetical protein
MLLTPCGVDLWNTLLYHLKALQLSFSLFFLFSPTLSEGYNTIIEGVGSIFYKDEFIMHSEIWISQICRAHNCRAVQKKWTPPLRTDGMGNV